MPGNIIIVEPEPEEITITKTIRVTGNGAIVANLLQVFGNVRIVDQSAVIMSVTTLANATNIYASLWDGTLAKDLTADGVVLSGMPVGTMFLKDLDVTQPYSVLDASEGQVNEVLQDNKAGKPFTVTQKSGVDTFMRLHLTTTDAPVDFTVFVKFIFHKFDGSNLVFL